MLSTSSLAALDEDEEDEADEALLEEVAGLVEWPNILMGSIDEDFMEVPSEALISAMRSHQKYFSLEALDGSLAPHFITVSNMPSDSARDATIIVGNAKVLRARLSDARFFWDQDLKSKLDERVSSLSKINFFDKFFNSGTHFFTYSPSLSNFSPCKIGLKILK